MPPTTQRQITPHPKPTFGNPHLRFCQPHHAFRAQLGHLGCNLSVILEQLRADACAYQLVVWHVSSDSARHRVAKKLHMMMLMHVVRSHSQ